MPHYYYYYLRQSNVGLFILLTDVDVVGTNCYPKGKLHTMSIQKSMHMHTKFCQVSQCYSIESLPSLFHQVGFCLYFMFTTCKLCFVRTNTLSFEA